MKLRLPLWGLISALTLSCSLALAASDPALTSVEQDLTRYEEQTVQLAPTNRVGAGRIMRYIPLVEGRLASSPSKGSAGWNAAQQRLDRLKAKLTAIQTGQATPPPPAAQPGRAASSPDDSLHQQFAREYLEIRIALPYVNARTMADPDERGKWQRALGRLTAIVDRFEDRSRPEVRDDLATYEQVKAKIEGSLGQVQAATGGLSRDDLARDHQRMEELVAKLGEVFAAMPENPHNDDMAKTEAYLAALDAFTSGTEYRQMQQAVADFAARYGSDREAIRAKFRMINGGTDWLSPQRKIPEAGFKKISERLDSIARNHSETIDQLEEVGAQSDHFYGAPGGSRLDPKYPLINMDEVNAGFAKYRKALELALRFAPDRTSARTALDGLNPKKQLFLDRMNQAIDAIRLAPSGTGFQGDLKQAERAVRDYWQSRGDKVLAVSIVGDWYVFDRDAAGQPLHYALPADVVSAMKGDGATAHVYRMTMITRDRAPAPPFAKNGVGRDWHIRIANLP